MRRPTSSCSQGELPSAHEPRSSARRPRDRWSAVAGRGRWPWGAQYIEACPTPGSSALLCSRPARPRAEPVRGVPRLARAAGVRRLRDALRPARARCRACALPVPHGVRALRRVPARIRRRWTPAWRPAPMPGPGRTASRSSSSRASAGWAAPLATLLRSAPWVEPALEQARPGAADAAGAAAGCASAASTRRCELARAAGARRRPMPGCCCAPARPPAQSGLTRAERLRNLQRRLRAGAAARRGGARPAHRAGRRRDDQRRLAVRGGAGAAHRRARRTSPRIVLRARTDAAVA